MLDTVVGSDALLGYPRDRVGDERDVVSVVGLEVPVGNRRALGKWPQASAKSKKVRSFIHRLNEQQRLRASRYLQHLFPCP